jgi:uncharacterized membrane protein (Fun14 family)
MNLESLIPTVTSIGGGFFIGILLGYFVKRVIKILMFFAGGIVGLLIYLEYQQIISVNLDRLESSTTYIITSVVSSLDNMTQGTGLTSLGIPLTASISTGFILGLTRS